MNSVGHYPNGRAMWRCDACRVVRPWSESWGWYGSMKDEDDGTMPAIWCSESCRQQLIREGITKPRHLARTPFSVEDELRGGQ